MFSKPWTLAAGLVACALFVLALSNSVYEVTSPFWLSWHVVLRKTYSIGAFALVGYLFRRAFVENGFDPPTATLIVVVALYSAGIEVGQFIHGSHEGLIWNAFDIACGAIGGAVASLLPERRPV